MNTRLLRLAALPAFPAFTVGANTHHSRYVALNQNGNVDDLKLTGTAMIAAQNYFWNDKIIATLGYRRPNVRNAINQSRVQPAHYTNDCLGLRRVYLNEPRSFHLSTALDF